MKNFSVSMCVYHGDDPVYFDHAVNSIYNQTVKPHEIVIVVDGPVSERTEEVLKHLEAVIPCIKVIYLPFNLGHAAARQRGLEMASNELVALMDSDDLSVPNRFEMQLKAFDEHPEVSVVGGLINEFIGNEENVVGTRWVPETDHKIKSYMHARAPLNNMTVMMRKEHVLAVGGFIDWYCEEDYYLWIRLALAKYQFYNIQDNLVNVRVGDEMYMRRGGWKYFQSEFRIQWFMFTHGVTNILRFLYNVLVRFAVQVLMPNKLRGWVFRKFARSKKKA